MTTPFDPLRHLHAEAKRRYPITEPLDSTMTAAMRQRLKVTRAERAAFKAGWLAHAERSTPPASF